MAVNSAERSTDQESAPGSGVPQPVVLAVAVLAATAVAAVVLTAGVRHTAASAQFSSQDEFVTWVALTIGLVGVSVAGGIYSWPAWRELVARSSRAARLGSYGLAVFTILCYDASPHLVGGTFLDVPYPPLYLGRMRDIVLILLIGTPTLPALSGLVLASLLLSRKKLPWDGSSARVAISELLRIRGYLQRFLTMLALVIGGNVLTLGGLRAALLANGQPVTSLPVAILLLYGALLTGLLALVYLPAYLSWQNWARELLDELYPLPLDGRASHDWYTGRADLEGLLSLKVNAGSVFVTGLGLLAPFASSIITAVVPGISPPS